jgi:uncharacterized protein (TIGR02145 family)
MAYFQKNLLKMSRLAYCICALFLLRCTEMPDYSTLTVNVYPPGGGSVSSVPDWNSSPEYQAGTVVRLTATANPGYIFVWWSGASTSTSGDISLTIKRNETVTANFIRTATPTSPATPGALTDSRDGKTYKTVVIGGQRWMAENLNYATSDSWCYNNMNEICDVYGRLYNRSAAIIACPAGWHLPTEEEWTELVNFVDSSTAGAKLKSKSPDWDGTDDYGFSAMPGGTRYSDGSFDDFGSWGNWWTARYSAVSSGTYPYYTSYIYTMLSMRTGREDAFFRISSSDYNNSAESVRCLQD